MKRILTIAGSDSGGGAGIQADLKTCQALNCYGMSAVSALTAQNTLGVFAVFPVEPHFIVAQIQTVLDDIGADAIKIGMLHRATVIEVVASCLKKYPHIPIVLDPVMVATSGDRLLDENAVDAMKIHLFPLVKILTPNLHEAKLLVEFSTREQAAMDLLKLGVGAVLIKGGHIGVAEDYLLQKGEKSGEILSADWVDTKNTHGTGCTLSTAIAVFLAQGFPLFKAVASAKAYLTQALIRGKNDVIGRGHGPVRHNCDYDFVVD